MVHHLLRDDPQIPPPPPSPPLFVCYVYLAMSTIAQSLESELNGLLGKLRETAGTGAMKALPWVNR